MIVSTSMVEHGSHSRIDLETTQRVWNPQYNNQLTEFSDESLFQYEDGTQATPVSLVSEGFLTDFEGTSAGFRIRRTLPPCRPVASGGNTAPFHHRHPCGLRLWC